MNERQNTLTFIINLNLEFIIFFENNILTNKKKVKFLNNFRTQLI